MAKIVVKFGGTSLANATQIRKAADIIRSNPARRFVVVSAPGKRFSNDIKVTDLLYQCHELAETHQNFEPVLNEIRNRYADIAAELEVGFDIDSEIEDIREHLNTLHQKDYMASRGEYLNAKLIAMYLNFPFVDPAEVVCFDENGQFDAELTNQKLATCMLSMKKAVVAGFYGAMPDGTIHTFSRGGSDITGSLVARAVQADLYENWTDVSGMMTADPRIVKDPKVIDYISYLELRELSYSGSSVFHEDAVFPVRKAGIPINIRNTNKPEDPGTMIVATLPRILPPRTVTGIAGMKGFVSIQVEKSLMNSEIGFGAKLLQIFADYNISMEHCPSGIDTMSVIVAASEFNPVRNQVMRDIREKLQPDAMFAEDSLALIAVVGHGMAYSAGVAAGVFAAVSEAGINIRMIDQGSSEMNIIIAVDEKDYEAAVCSIYDKFLA